MKIAVLGLGISGKAAYKYLLKRVDEVVGLEGSDILYPDGVELVVKSPGIPITHPWVQTAYAHQIPVIGEVDLGFAELQKRGKTVFGITGSNGKTTTTLLTIHLLNGSGKKAIAVGNVGLPLISQVDSDVDVFVVELSSFQLETVVERPVLDAAVILNITPNHLDRHSSFEAYKQAKMRIACCLKKEAPLYQKEDYLRFKEEVERILSLVYRETRLKFYSHDEENLAAAYALMQVPDESIVHGMATFKRPAHRLEFVREIKGVTFINDSKATSVDAVLKATEAIDSPIVLLAGGVDKGGIFSDWIPLFREKVVRVFAYGEAAKRIEKELNAYIPVNRVGSLEVGVVEAAKLAIAGETVLLSPGCSSFDQFNDYQQRGEKFKKLVLEKL